MNGRFITGQMFLELCRSYTDAINKGSVPNINSAWSNLCKNENLRAVDEAIQQYHKKIQSECVQIDATTKKELFVVDLNQLKNINKQIRQEVIQNFQEKAFGDDTTAGVERINKEIDEFYAKFK